MSRAYDMRVEIAGHDPARIEEIKAAAEEEWPFDDWCEGGTCGEELSAHAEDNLTAGETEEQFAERLSLSIWRANGAYCDVTVQATYLENLPCETHHLGQSDYARLIQGQNQNPSAGEESDEDHVDRGR
jgi:hypothetical protein